MEVFILSLLALTSIVSVAFIIERGIALRWEKVVPPKVTDAAGSCQSAQELPMLRRMCADQPSPMSRLLTSAIDHLHLPREENLDALETRARREIAHLERGLVVLEIVTGIAPLMGLVGTIYGMITLFAGLGATDLSDNSHFAQGISLALRATLMGLLIAIPSLIAWSYYTKKVESLAVEMETICDEFLRRHYRLGK